MSDRDESFIRAGGGGVNQMVLARDPNRSIPDPDAATLQACRRGDREALGRVLGARAPMLGRLIGRLIGHGPDVDDLLQITMVSAIRAFPRFRGEATLNTWLQRIAINAVRSHARQPRQRAAVSLTVLKADAGAVDGLDAIGASSAADAAPSAEQVIDDRRRLARLGHHLAALGPDKRIAFVLHVVEGLPIEEIAAMTGAGRFAVRSRIFWAGRALRSRAKKDPALRDLFPPDKEPS